MKRNYAYLLLASLLLNMIAFNVVMAQNLESVASQNTQNPVLNTTENSKWLTKKGRIQPEFKSVYFFEGFETPTEGNTLPIGWTQKRTTTTAGEPVADAESPRWFRNSTEYGFPTPLNYVYNGTASMAIGYTAPDFTWAITPEITIPETEGDVNLSYWAWIRSALPTGFEEPVITNYFIKVLMDGEWITLYSYFGVDGVENIFEEQLVHTMNPFRGKTVQIAFIYEYFGWQMAIDDIFVGETLDDDFGLEELSAYPTFGLLEGDQVDLGFEVFCNGLNSGAVEVQLIVNDEVYATHQTQPLTQGSESEFIIFNWVAPSDGNFNLKVILPEDQFAANNELSLDIVVNQYQNLTEDFENFEFDELGIPYLQFPPEGWSVSDPAWVTATEQWPVFDGVSGLLHGRIGEGTKSLITAPVELTWQDEWISFYLEGVNNNADVGDTEGASPPGIQGFSTFQLKYSNNPGGPWTNLGDFIEFKTEYITDENNDTIQVLNANRQRFIKQDISNLQGTVYFAFTGFSNFNLVIGETVYRSFVIIDNVMVGRDATQPQDVTISVTDPSDNPLADAMIYLSIEDQPMEQLRTNENGAIDLTMVPGLYNYRIMKLGFAIEEGTIEITEPLDGAKESHAFNIKLSVPETLYSLTINAKDTEDNILQDVMIALTQYYFEGNTNEQGSLVIEGLVNTTFGLLYTKDNYIGGESTIEIDGANENIDIVLTALNVNVTTPLNNTVNIFPNPAKEFLHINSSSEIRVIEIFDISGRNVKSVTHPGTEYRMTITDLESGIYIFKVETKNGTFIQKVNIE